MARSRPAYQVEPVELSSGIWTRGRATAWEFLRICAWKSARNLAHLPLNSEALIQERTEHAVTSLRWAQNLDVRDADTDWDRWEASAREAIGSSAAGTGLLGLRGVDYPVATGFLCILNPAAFPVLDRWAIRDLYGPDEPPRRHYRAAAYRAYASALLAKGGAPGLNIHELDQAAMHRGMAPR